jgi:DNA-binding response OmpR family regulator
VTTAPGNLRLIQGGSGGDDTWDREMSRRAHPARRAVQATVPLLYVSGDRDSRIRFARVARRWERVKLVVVEGGRAGIRMAEQHRPHLVVVDDTLPDADAADVITYLRQRTLPTEVPIVVLARNDEPLHQARLCRAGVSALHTQPLNIGVVDRSVATLLGRTGLRAADTQPTAEARRARGQAPTRRRLGVRS